MSILTQTAEQKAEFKAAMDASGVVDTVARAAAVDAKDNPTLTASAIGAAGGATAVALAFERARIDAGVGGVASVADDLALGPDGSFILRAPAAAAAAVGAVAAQSPTLARLSAAQVAETTLLQNLFTPATVEDDKLLSNGQANAAAFTGGYVTPFTPVAPGSYVTWSHPGAGATWGVQFYGLDKSYVSTPGTSQAGVPILIPAGVFWARNSFFRSEAPFDQMMFVHGQTLPASYIPYGPATRTNDRAEALANARRTRPATLNLLTRFIAGVYVAADGSDAALSELSTAVIPVGGLTQVTVSYALPSYLGFYWRTIDGRKIAITPGPIASGAVLTVPTGAAFLYYTINTASITTENWPDRPLFMEGAVTLPSVMGATSATVADGRPWFGKRFLFQGDSRMQENSWPRELGVFLGAASVTNVARGGRPMKDALKKTIAGVESKMTSDDVANIDCLVMMLGLNGSNSVGTMDDAYPAPGADRTADDAPTALIPGMRFAIEQFRFWNPLMKIVIFGNIQSSGAGVTFDGVSAARQAEKLVCERHSVAYLDLWQESSLTTYNSPRFMPDLIHPTPEGSKMAFVQPAKGFFQSHFPLMP